MLTESDFYKMIDKLASRKYHRDVISYIAKGIASYYTKSILFKVDDNFILELCLDERKIRDITIYANKYYVEDPRDFSNTIQFVNGVHLGSVQREPIKIICTNDMYWMERGRIFKYVMKIFINPMVQRHEADKKKFLSKENLQNLPEDLIFFPSTFLRNQFFKKLKENEIEVEWEVYDNTYITGAIIREDQLALILLGNS